MYNDIVVFGKTLRSANLKLDQIIKDNEKILTELNVDTTVYDLLNMSNDQFSRIVEGQKVMIENARKAEEERIENERKLKLHNQRKDSILHLWNFTEPELRTANLAEISDEGWNNILVSLNQEKKDYDEKIEKERLENERLKAEKIEKEKQLELERIEREKQAKIERDKAEALLQEQKRLAKIESDKKEKQLADEKAKTEKLQKEIKEKAEAEEKALKEKQLAEKKAKRAPEKQKLLSFASEIELVKLPDVTSDEAKAILNDTKALIVKLTTFIKQKAETL